MKMPEIDVKYRIALEKSYYVIELLPALSETACHLQ